MEITAADLVFVLMQVLVGLFLADFITGLIHWFEDRYGNPNWPFIGQAIMANHEHHFTPRTFLSGTFWDRNKEVFIGTVIILCGFYAASAINIVTVSATMFGFFANEIHGAAHKFPKENPPWVRMLQKMGLMQSFLHHARHHRDRKDRSYCVMTNYVNPVLDAICFFRGLEWVIRILFRASPRMDPSVPSRLTLVD